MVLYFFPSLFRVTPHLTTIHLLFPVINALNEYRVQSTVLKHFTRFPVHIIIKGLGLRANIPENHFLMV